MWVQGNAAMYVSSKTRTAYLPDSVQLPSLGITGSSVSVAIIIAILIAVALYIVLYKTTFGYELRATGFNKHGAEYAGMNGKKNIVLTMVIAGGLAGMAGAFAILAPTPWFGFFSFDSSELPIVTLYAAYIPIFAYIMRKETDLGIFRRFIAPGVAIFCSGFMMYAAYVSHGPRAILGYLAVFAAVMLIGAMLRNSKPEKSAE